MEQQKCDICQGQVVYFMDWIKAGTINVADMMSPASGTSYQRVCTLIGDATHIVLLVGTLYRTRRSIHDRRITEKGTGSGGRGGVGGWRGADGCITVTIYSHFIT